MWCNFDCIPLQKKTQEHGQDTDQSKEAESKPTIPDVQSDPVADMTSPDDDSTADSDDSFEKVDATELPKWFRQWTNVCSTARILY